MLNSDIFSPSNFQLIGPEAIKVEFGEIPIPQSKNNWRRFNENSVVRNWKIRLETIGFGLFCGPCFMDHYLWTMYDGPCWRPKFMIQKSRRAKFLTGFLIYPSSLKSNQTWLNTKIKDQLTYNYFISVNVKDSFRKGNSLFVLRRDFFCEHPCYFEIIKFNKMKKPLTYDYVEKYIDSY